MNSHLVLDLGQVSAAQLECTPFVCGCVGFPLFLGRISHKCVARLSFLVLHSNLFYVFFP